MVYMSCYLILKNVYSIFTITSVKYCGTLEYLIKKYYQYHWEKTNIWCWLLHCMCGYHYTTRIYRQCIAIYVVHFKGIQHVN